MMRLLRRLPLLLALLALVGLVFLAIAPEIGWARAGGGSNYGGGGGGGGSGGGGGGDGDLIFFLIWLCIKYPVIGIPLLIGFVALAVFGGKSAREGHVSRTIRRGAALQKTNAQQQALSTLRLCDPDFDEAQFLARAGAAFVKIQDAWSNQNLSPARPFISDGIHQRFSLQIDMQQAEGYRNLMEDVRVLDSEIVAIYSDDHFDTIHVRIPVSAVDYNVDAKTGRRVSGSKDAESFTEYWSFHRRHGAKTVAQPGSIEGNCPSCAAPLKIVDSTKCESCGSTVNSGEHDWVLAEITQVQEWRLPDSDRRVPGLAKLKQVDPAFSVQHVEDRASVMFYRLKAAAFFNSTDYVTPILADSAGGIPRLEQMPKDEYWKDPAVGKVEVLDVKVGNSGERDRVRVMVRWSGTRLSGQPGIRSKVVRRQAIYTHVYVLVREQGVKSLASQTFASSSCGGCGAPIAVSKEKACGFCGTSLVDGQHDWVLDDILPFTHDMAFRPQQRSADRAPQGTASGNGDVFDAPFISGDAELSLAVLSRIVWVDGEAHKKERKALSRLGKRWGLSQQQMQDAFESARDGDVELPIPDTREEANVYMKQLFHISLADGRLSSEEQRLLYDYGQRMNYTKSEVRHTIAREKREMYQQARELQRLKKKNGRGTSA
jgi:uncharacterized tellurite resistance protein B-like protein